MALRLIEFMLPEDNSGWVAKTLDGLHVLGRWQQSIDEGLTLVRVLVEADQAEDVISAFEKKYAHLEGFRAILMEVKATVPPVEVPEEVPQDDKENTEAEKPSPERIACLELVEKLAGGVEISRNYILAVVLSVIVVTVGLVRDNVAIIIGAMVIAPLLTPNMALSLATTLGDGKLARRALKANSLGMFMALILAALVGFAMCIDPTGSEIASRAAVGYSDIVLALAAGSAGALAFTSGVSAALVGVMVAVAILPPIAAAGLLMGSGHLAMGVKALLLTLANIICVNLSGVGIFLLQGVRPRFFWEAARARRMVKIAAAAWIGLLALLIGVIYLSRKFITV
jgi:uncharacterized hydrophobic protein (TIGR00341 family)